MIVGDDVEGLGKGRDLVLPERRKPGQPRNEQDRKPDALPLVIERAIADHDSRHGPTIDWTQRRYHRARTLSNDNRGKAPMHQALRMIFAEPAVAAAQPCLKFDTWSRSNCAGSGGCGGSAHLAEGLALRTCVECPRGAIIRLARASCQPPDARRQVSAHAISSSGPSDDPA